MAGLANLPGGLRHPRTFGVFSSMNAAVQGRSRCVIVLIFPSPALLSILGTVYALQFCQIDSGIVGTTLKNSPVDLPTREYRSFIQAFLTASSCSVTGASVRYSLRLGKLLRPMPLERQMVQSDLSVSSKADDHSTYVPRRMRFHAVILNGLARKEWIRTRTQLFQKNCHKMMDGIEG